MRLRAFAVRSQACLELTTPSCLFAPLAFTTASWLFFAQRVASAENGDLLARLAVARAKLEEEKQIKEEVGDLSCCIVNGRCRRWLRSLEDRLPRLILTAFPLLSVVIA